VKGQDNISTLLVQRYRIHFKLNFCKLSNSKKFVRLPECDFDGNSDNLPGVQLTMNMICFILAIDEG
jgi:hypothetical protein